MKNTTSSRFLGICLLLVLLFGAARTQAQSYCTTNLFPPPFAKNCTFGDNINSFTFGSFSHLNTGCSSGGYGNFSSQTISVTAGATYDFSVTTQGPNNEYLEIWVDFDNNGTFDNNGAEHIYNGTTPFAPADLTGAVTIPSIVSTGNRRMRVRLTYSNAIALPCGSYNFGEIHDYTLSIAAPCTPPTAYSVTGGGNSCGGAAVAIGLAGSQSGVTYQLKRSDSTNVGSPVSGTGSAIDFAAQSTVGTYTVAATKTADGCTATMTGSATVVVPLPTISGCPTNQSLNVTAGACAQNFSIPAPTLASDCSGTLTWQASFSGNANGNPANLTGLTNGAASSAISCSKGTTSVSLSASDASGNLSASNCAFTVTVADNESPVLTCPSPISVNNTPGLCTGTATLTAPTAMDNCPLNVTSNAIACDGSNDYVESTPLALGTGDFAVEFWVKGNSFNTYPVMFAQDQSGNGSTTFRLEVTTAAGNVMLFSMADPSGAYVNYNTTATLSTGVWTHMAVVRSGNTFTTYKNGVAVGTATATGTIDQSTNPFNLRIGSRRSASNAAENPFNGSFDEFRVWNVARSAAQLTANMNSELVGNEAGLIRYYRFNEGVPGQPNAGVTTAFATVGPNGTLNNFALSGSASNWVAGAITFNATPTSNAPATYTTGSNTVTWTVSDASGNTGTCAQIVTVVDNEKPAISGCPANQSLNVAAGSCAQNFSIPAPSVSDNCTGTTWNAAFSGNANGTPTNLTGLAAGAPSGSLSFSKGATTVTLSASDASGNVSAANCTFTVAVADNELPAISGCPASQSLNVTAGACAQNFSIPAPTISDNCIGATWSAAFSGNANGAPSDLTNLAADAPSGSLSFSKGATLVMLSASDASGNVSAANCTFTVAVSDNEAPVPSVANLPTINGDCSATPTAPTATDNCAGALTGTTATTFPITAIGTTVVTWAFDDGDGNTFSQNQNVVIACDTDNDGFTVSQGDCDDNDASIRPDATETDGDGIDQNCDGAEICMEDADDDGYRPNPAATVAANDGDCLDAGEAILTDPTGDCDDANAAAHPGAPELPGDGIDENCDGAELCYRDLDDDGYRANASFTVASADADCADSGEAANTDPTGDCADTDAARFPGNSETCDGKDNDCVNGVPYTEADADNDGSRICGGDCDDANAAINPSATEFVCNGLDDDCDGSTDEGADATPPTASCKTNVTITLVGGAGAVEAAQLNDASSDACSGTTLSLSITSGTTSYTCASIAASPFAVVLQVADAAGNTSTCASSVSVVDALMFSEIGRRNASDGLAADKFGWGTALEGSTAASSAPDAKVGTQSKQGAAYLFDGASAWAQFKKLTASDGAAADYFGIALSLDGTTALAGAYGDNIGANNDQGSAYVFYKDLGGANNWGQAKKLAASDGAAYDYFGTSAAIKNGFALAGANKAKVGANAAQGAAYVFQKDLGGADNWGQAKKLTASDGAASNFFGAAASLNADASLALVGANGNQSNRGAAYLFGKDTGGAGNWGQIAKWTASDGAASDWFGASLSLSGSYAIVGAPNKASSTGAAYVFKDAGGWSQAKKLVASDGAAGDKFGSAVAISGDYAYVGAPMHAGKGAVYVFQKNQGGADNWGQIGKYTASDGAASDQYGFSLAASAAALAVGANLDDRPSKADQGSMYVLGAAYSCGGGMAAPGEDRAKQSLENQLDVRCSPNPFADELHIETSSASALRLTVADVAGRAVAQVDLPAGAARFDLRTGDFPPGLYFVRAVDGAGHVRVVPVARAR